MTGSNARTVAAVVLAFSRFELLQQLVDALRNQTRRPDEIIIVYQGSRPDIEEWLLAQADLTVLRQANRGSAGGFCRGIEESIARGHSWTWIFDDDAVPEPGALQALVATPHFVRNDVALLSSRIVDRNGKTYMSPAATNGASWYSTVLEDHCVEVADGTWLGLMVGTEAVRSVGLPIAEFFLWDEDREFISRLLRFGNGYCAIDSVIVHFQNPEFDPFGDDFIKIAYYARNSVARQKLGPAPAPVKAFRVARRCLDFLQQAARREVPIRTLLWALNGAFLFWPRVRHMK